MIISAAVEGDLDAAVVNRLIEHVGGKPGRILVKEGKQNLLPRIRNYNDAAKFDPWLVLIDLDHDAECAPSYLDNLYTQPAPGLCFRIAVREIEAWLLADSEAIARFLSVRTKISPNPETLPDPKQYVVNLARKSGHRKIRFDIAPRDGSKRSVGTAYSSRMMEYVQSEWRPEVASQQAPSLDGAIRCLRRLVEETKT